MTREEEVLGKAYDGRLMRRIIGYAMPYFRWIVLSFFLALIVTAADLSRPYLIKVAIDSHINTLQSAMVAYPKGEAPKGVPGTTVDGQVYVRVSDLSKAPSAASPRYTIETSKGAYALMTGVPAAGSPTLLKGGQEVRIGSHTYPAIPLTKADIASFRQEDVSGLQSIGFFYFLALLLAFASNYAQGYILQWVGQSAIFQVRKDVITKIEKMAIAFFDKNPVGRLVTRATNDVEALEEMYTSVLVNFVKDALILIGVVVIMFQMDSRLALFALVVLPVALFATNLYRQKARVAYRNVRVSLARINAFISENISGMRVVQAFNREEAQKLKFQDVNGSFLKAGLREVMLFAIFRPFMDFLYAIAVAALVWFGGGAILQGAVTFGVVYAFVSYLSLLFQPINDITQKYSILQSAMAASERIFLLIDRESEVKDPDQPTPMAKAGGEVNFDHVWFAYEDENWILRDVTFRVHPGETVAFVGPTGAGKTSIMSLLARFYDLQKGQILVDGLDVRTVSQADLRRKIAVVHQEVFIFAGTIRQNISLNLDLTHEAVEAAARAVGAHDFIMRLPGGYDEPVQERGSTLSTGQRQLLSFARALAADPAILVLDEATSSVDTETEFMIQDALRNLSEGRTTIVVAHRLSTVQHADRIIVLQKGKIREMGTHSELLDRNGLYADLYRLQYGGLEQQELA